MKQASLLLLPGLYLLAGCVPNEQAKGLPTVASNQLGMPPPGVMANLPSADWQLAGKVFAVGHKIVAANKNCGLDANLAFVTYPAPTVEIFHPDRTRVFVTEGLVRKCDEEQLAAMLALELGRMAAERMAASPYLDIRSFQEPIHLQTGSDKSSSEIADWARFDGQQRPSAKSLPDPRQLAQAFLESAKYGKNCLDSAYPIVEEAGLSHNIEMRVKGLPSRSDWQPLK
jgi:hypothetical protein